jgi:DNA-binding NarL/FixJ family response regulator
MKILFIDDNEMMRIFFRDIFWIHGLANKYEVTTVDSVAKAEEIVLDVTKRPDVIFLDLLMPTDPLVGASSAQTEPSVNLLKKIKESEDLKHIKVVVFSSFREKDIRERMISCGADHYLVKGDFMPKEIIDFVKNLNDK